MSRFLLQNFEYPYLEPPFPIRTLAKCTKDEARQHFDWFVQQSEPRRILLTRAVRATGGDADTLDYTRDSLVGLWAWAQQYLSARPRSGTEHKEFMKGAPHWASRIEIDDRELTAPTQCLVVDIGFYFAQVFICAHANVRWALGTKRLGIPNQPFLTGFKYALVPYETVAGCAWAAVRGGDDEELARVHDVWAGDLA